MIHGIGTDIVEYARIEALWTRYGERFAARILNERELAECRASSHPARLRIDRCGDVETACRVWFAVLETPVAQLSPKRAQRMREEVFRSHLDVTCRRFKGEDSRGRYNLHGISRRGSAKT